MTDYMPILVVGFAISLGLTPLSRQIAQRIGQMDKPNPRKVHHTPMPLMGGMAIYGGFVLALALFGTILHQYVFELSAIVLTATFLAFVGFVDDRINLSPRVKFPAQFLAAGTMVLAGIRVDLFHSDIPDILLTVFWIVGIINATNFLDNMDGLAAGMSAIAAFWMFVLAASQGQELVSALAAAICGAAIGFLVYNFNPATTFMGDMGSLVLGFMLAAMGIKLRFLHQSPLITWMIPILVLGLPIFDTSLVVFTRLREGRSPFKGGKDHTSHRLILLGLSHRAAVLVLYAVCISLGGAAFIISKSPDVNQGMIIGGIIAILAAFSFVLLEVVYIRNRQRQGAAHS